MVVKKNVSLIISSFYLLIFSFNKLKTQLLWWEALQNMWGQQDRKKSRAKQTRRAAGRRSDMWIQFSWSVNLVIGTTMHVEASFLCAQSLFWTRQKHSGKENQQCARQWMDNKKQKPIIASRGWPSRMDNEGQCVCRRDCVYRVVCMHMMKWQIMICM